MGRLGGRRRRMRTELHSGTVFWMTIDRGAGREQHGRRPVLVVSDARLTALGLVLAVPLSTTDRGWDFHVRLNLAGRVTFAMCEQIRSVAVERLSTQIGAISFAELVEVRGVLRSLLSL